MMQAADQSRFSTRDAYRVLFRHKWRAVTVFMGTIVLLVAALIVCPRTYESESRLILRVGRESVTLDPTATTLQTTNVFDSRESEFRSFLDVLRSRVVLEQVVDDVGPEAILNPNGKEVSCSVIGTAMGSIKAAMVAVGMSESLSARERAIVKLEKSVSIDSTRKSTVVSITGKAPSPAAAQKIVRAFVDAYYRIHHQVHRTAGSHEFFETQTELLRRKLTAATEELRDLKNEVGLVSIEGQRGIIEGQITNLDRQLLETDAALSSSAARIAALRKAHPDLPAWTDAVGGSGLSTNAIDDMRDQLYTLQIREREMEARYKDSHPLLALIQEQGRRSQRVLDEQELKIEESTAASLRAKIKALTRKHDEALDRLHDLNENEVRVSELERQVALLKTSYQSYSTNRELARISEDIERTQISNVNLVQPATFSAKPTSPKRKTILLLGLVVATLGAAGIVVLSEQMDQSIKTPEEIEDRLSVPVLVSIPRTSGQRLLLN